MLTARRRRSERLALRRSGSNNHNLAGRNRALFRALRLEKLVTALFIGLITFVAGLNILVVLAMTVTDRARDIAVLMSLGPTAIRFATFLFCKDSQ